MMIQRLGIDLFRRRPIGVVGPLLLCATAGCPSALNLSGGNGADPATGPVDGNRDTTLTSPLGKTSGEPNDDFGDTIVAVFDAQRVARLEGAVARQNDLDVFQLGALSPGDRVTVDVSASRSVLDVSAALFDSSRRVVFNNDDRSADDFDSHMDWIVRHAADTYYLVITHSAFAGRGRFSGAYSADVRVQAGMDVPEPASQILVLDFDGATVNSPTLGGRFSLDPFDAARIHSMYRGETETIKDQIRRVTEANFARFRVTVLTTDDPLPAGAMFTSVIFGGFDPMAFGIAEAVDLYNVDLCDDAMIFTESFSPSVFRVAPTALEMGTAIGNVATHEAGHVLGLNHVSDDLDLMDDRSAADAFLADQEFMESPLSSDIMTIGTQDAVLLLAETVGLR